MYDINKKYIVRTMDNDITKLLLMQNVTNKRNNNRKTPLDVFANDPEITNNTHIYA